MTAPDTFDDLGPVLVVIPTYNERENLEGVTRRVRHSVPRADVLVVDDASPDRTGELAEDMAAGDGRVHTLHRECKGGLGAAYLAGFRWALAAGYHVLVEMDADGSHQPEELARLLHALRGADLVLGSRWVPGGRVLNWPPLRAVLSRGGNMYTRALLGVPVRDMTGGFRAYRSRTLECIDLGAVESQGYCFQVDLAARTVRAGLRVVEVPITFVERTKGVSKMSGGVVAEAVTRITVWGLRRRWVDVRAHAVPERR